MVLQIYSGFTTAPARGYPELFCLKTKRYGLFDGGVLEQLRPSGTAGVALSLSPENGAFDRSRSDY